MIISPFLILLAVFSTGDCQIPPLPSFQNLLPSVQNILPSVQNLPLLPSAQNLPLPSVNTFLTWLLNVTTNEIDNLANNFNFHTVSSKDIKFLLYSRPPNIQATIINSTSIDLIDPSKPTKIMIHGWQASGEDDVNKELAGKYHLIGNYNVISADWSEHSKKVYTHSSRSTKDVGHMIGDFVLEVTKKDLKYLDNIHLIGHSLGGHVAGFAGQRVKERSKRKVGRITGLDVAAPMFEIPRRLDSESRLSGDDADFVDVIHTNAGFLGVTNPIGTVDFFVENGGPLQPGCFNLNIFESFACSHLKAFEYFKDSIGDKTFEALSCRNSIDYHILLCINNRKVVMGEHTPRDIAGTFYLEADSALPYRIDRFRLF